MIKLVLITGFLGAGKTTLMQEILSEYNNAKVGVIVNEFGEINIDARLIEQESGEGIRISELSNGSIFCACIKDKFVDSLIEMSLRDLDYLFIEASGLADPANINQILKGIEHKVLNSYDYKGAICVIDGENFTDLYELLPAIKSQLRFCGAVVINKADIITEDELGSIMEIIDEINPAVARHVTSYCKIDVKEIIDNLVQSSAEDEDTSNTYETRPVTFIIKGTRKLPIDALYNFIEAISGNTYRIKGFANTDAGYKEISAVGKNIHVNDWNATVDESNLIVISSVGFRLMSELTENIKKYLDGFVRL